MEDNQLHNPEPLTPPLPPPIHLRSLFSGPFHPMRLEAYKCSLSRGHMDVLRVCCWMGMSPRFKTASYIGILLGSLCERFPPGYATFV